MLLNKYWSRSNQSQQCTNIPVKPMEGFMIPTGTYILWWQKLTRVFCDDTHWHYVLGWHWQSSYHLGNHSTSSMMRNLLIYGDWVLSGYSIDKACVWVMRDASNDAKLWFFWTKFGMQTTEYEIFGLSTHQVIFHVISTRWKNDVGLHILWWTS